MAPPRTSLFALLVGAVFGAAAFATPTEDRVFWLDTLSQPGQSELGTQWSAFTDRVMGGVSDVEVEVTTDSVGQGYHLTGDVRTANNGGFVQMALPLSADRSGFNATAYDGVYVKVKGNGEAYAIHLRTSSNRMPWDYYSASFTAGSGAEEIFIPFSAFERAYGGGGLTLDSLTRIAVVGIGRDFRADITVYKLGLYRAPKKS